MIQLPAAERHIRAVHDAIREGNFESPDEVNAFLAELVASGEILKPDTSKLSPERRAQELVYDATEADGDKRRELIDAALALDPLCVDALLLQADELDSVEEALTLVERAVEAGRKSLPSEYFDDPQYLGRFWKIIETRPFMRALAMQAELLNILKEHDRAIDVAFDMLDFDPTDNQGVRCDLPVWLIKSGQDDEALELLNAYGDDPSAAFPYLRVLLAFRESGESSRTRRLLLKALDANSNVIDVLREPQLPAAPENYEIGDFNEAILIVRSQLPLWAENGKFMQWMFQECARLYPA